MAVDGEQPAAGQVYGAPEDRHLVVEHGRLRLEAGPPVCSQRPSGSVLFQSLARDLGPRAMGVLLTAASIILMYGPDMLDRVSAGSAHLFVWNVALWPAAACLLFVALLGLCRFAPNLQAQKWT